ncbi:MAG: hypothetical protein ACOVQA_13860 [Thermoflexibacteraceae bacterium]
MKKLFYFFALGIASVACNKTNEAASPEQTIVREPISYVIRPSKMYWVYDIKERFAKNYVGTDSLKVLMDLAQSQITKAKQLENQDLQKSIHGYQRALTYFPSVAVYAKVAELLLKEHELSEAQEAIRAAIDMQECTFGDKIKEFDTQTGLKPPTQANLRLLLLKTMSENQYYEELVYEMTEAYEKGFIDKNTILTDPLFEKFRKTPQYKLFYAVNLSAPAEREEARRTYFLEQFPMVDLPFKMAVTPPKLNRDANFDNPYYIDNPIETKYRETLKTYINGYTARFKTNGQFDLLMINADTTQMESVGADFRCFNYILFSLDKKGEVIDQKNVAFRSPYTEASCEINAEGTTVIIEEFERKWKKDYQQSGKDNELLSTTPTGKKTWQISPEGKFVEQTQ